MESIRCLVGSRIVVAISGGVDSLALLHLIASIGSFDPLEFLAVHVHHGMRAEAADADVEFLRQTCDAWGVPLEVVYRDVPALAAERRISVEEAGRIARYEALEALARERGCNKVVTAHHADDQVETVLLHLLRGTGLDGLRGMPERRPLSPKSGAPELVRPLLGVWRHELEAYCREHGLEPRHDWTNDDLRYRRNRLRQEVIPLLQSLAPAVKQHLLQLAQQARDEVAVLEPLAADLLHQARRPAPEPWRRAGGPPEWLVLARALRPTALDAATFAQAPRATARRALRLLFREVAGPPADVPFEAVEAVLCLAGGVGTAVDLPGCGIRARRVSGTLLLERQRPPQRDLPEKVLVAGPGEYTVPAMGLKLRFAAGAAPADPRLPPEEACLASAAVRWPLRLRAPERGDRFQPLGSPGSRLLSDVFVDRKIPAEARASWPVLEDTEGILWVCGIAVAERARVASPGDPCLRLRIEPIHASGSTLGRSQVS